MARLREIKNRIVAVGKTKKITRTMEMVSTSKLKKWQHVVFAARPYDQALRDVLRKLSGSPAASAHPLMAQRKQLRRAAVVVLTSNRGLCGAFNTTLSRVARLRVEELRAQGVEAELYVVGKQALSYFRHLGVPLAYTNITLTDSFSAEESRQFARLLIEGFLEGRLDQVDVVYSHFISAGTQRVVTEQLLPLQAPAPGAEREAEEVDFIFEPGPEQIIDTLLPLFARSMVYRMVAENITSEQAARRRAMKQATDNADEMIKHLTRTMNRERQNVITKELSEIVGGAEAIKAG